MISSEGRWATSIAAMVRSFGGGKMKRTSDTDGVSVCVRPRGRSRL